MLKPTLGERIAALEQAITDGFKNINDKFDNHLTSHREREKIFWYIIIALISVIGRILIN